MDELVAEDSLFRKIDACIDFTFIYEEVKDLYCCTNGRPCIDPVVLFKIVFIEALEGLKSMRKTCEKIKVEFYSKRIQVEKYANNNKMGMEEAGRKIRYEFFEEICKQTGGNKIAVAHNKNDKVETIIMHILRGSGISGLKGIEPKRDEKYIRPLIECDRTEIEKYCFGIENLLFQISPPGACWRIRDLIKYIQSSEADAMNGFENRSKVRNGYDNKCCKPNL